MNNVRRLSRSTSQLYPGTLYVPNKALWEHTECPDASWKQVKEEEADSPLEQNFDADVELFGRSQSPSHICDGFIRTLF